MDLGGFEARFEGDVHYSSFQCQHSFYITGDPSINLSALSLLTEEVFDV